MKQPIRALLLAAGFGTRLRPLTKTTPKCLMSIAGQPLLGHWLKNLEACGCTDALINTHYLAEQVHEYLNKRPKGGMGIHSIYETKLLGTAGTLLANKDFFKGSTGLLIHADNATDFDLRELIEAHHQRQDGCLITMLTFNTDNPSSCGIVEIDDQHIVQAFHEKIAEPPGYRANGALYAFGQEFLEYLNLMNPMPSDFSTEVIPKLLGRIQTKHTNRTYLDIGTPETLSLAQKIMRHQQ